MKFRLEDSVNHRIATLAVLLKRQVYKVIAENDLNITPDQWVVMYCLWQENGLSVGEISKRTQKDFANVTRIIEKLEKRAYIQKSKSTEDNRKAIIHILPQADEIRATLERCILSSTELALQGISQQEQQDFIKILDKIEQNVLEGLK